MGQTEEVRSAEATTTLTGRGMTTEIRGRRLVLMTAGQFVSFVIKSVIFSVFVILEIQASSAAEEAAGDTVDTAVAVATIVEAVAAPAEVVVATVVVEMAHEGAVTSIMDKKMTKDRETERVSHARRAKEASGLYRGSTC